MISDVILIFTDGRGSCLRRTVASMQEAWGAEPVDGVCIVNDSADPKYADWLNQEYAAYERIHHKERRGFAGAIQSGWSWAADADYVFHLEDDFLFNKPIDVTGMIAVLENNPDVVQMALLRQPVNDIEASAGGLMQMWPDEYVEKSAPLMAFGSDYDREVYWVEHRLFFTTNPCFYRGGLTSRGWPDAPDSERKFTNLLLEGSANRFAFYGRKFEAPRVHHIGDERVGTGY